MKDLIPFAALQKVFTTVFLTTLVSLYINAQTARQINRQSQSWFSVNTTAHINDRWSILADAHIRRNHFMASNNFEFVRTGIQYSVDKSLSFAAGYGHMWIHPTTAGWKTVSNENRIYQQVILLSKFHHVGIMQRLRNEQRWQQKMAADKFTGDLRFTNRLRYLLSFTIPVFKNDKLPALCIADEVALHAGKEVVYNTFDQNRLFIGIREKLSKDLSFDTGYMIVYQQKYSGYQYDLNNTFRLFFYYTPDLSKKHKG
ncbi:MAG: DUF2490 domain-containing protein [Chitinophagaceae bacterium]|nr:DUF2490 domain-containing protein [Chitinophagaceae bacterium]